VTTTTVLRSIRSSFRGRTSERGYVLISAIVLAILYFALMELMLIDSSRALREAQRFRARIVAATLTESAAELASMNFPNRSSQPVSAEDDQGKMTATIEWTGGEDQAHWVPFMITATGESTGVPPQKADVRVQGSYNTISRAIRIDYTFHSQ